MMGMRLLFNCLISQSITSIGSSTKWSLSSTRSSSNGITTLLSVMSGLDSAFDLDDLLGGVMNYCGTSKLSIGDLDDLLGGFMNSAQHMGDRHFRPYSASNGAAFMLVW
ncbi:hypothetical protein Tco_1125092 [Tanacetum coccineum]|uniref:Uncharacterized protein n=1 Tax=Tanacetum coccineum TaxID=301880 RepID=A0ABQ5J804_9ASTR